MAAWVKRLSIHPDGLCNTQQASVSCSQMQGCPYVTPARYTSTLQAFTKRPLFSVKMIQFSSTGLQRSFITLESTASQVNPGSGDHVFTPVGAWNLQCGTAAVASVSVTKPFSSPHWPHNPKLSIWGLHMGVISTLIWSGLLCIYTWPSFSCEWGLEPVVGRMTVVT